MEQERKRKVRSARGAVQSRAIALPDITKERASMDGVERNLIGLIQKNASEQLRLAFADFGGRIYVDIRVYVRDGRSQKFVPTKKGICINAKACRDLVAHLTRATEML